MEGDLVHVVWATYATGKLISVTQLSGLGSWEGPTM